MYVDNRKLYCGCLQNNALLHAKINKIHIKHINW